MSTSYGKVKYTIVFEGEYDLDADLYDDDMTAEEMIESDKEYLEESPMDFIMETDGVVKDITMTLHK